MHDIAAVKFCLKYLPLMHFIAWFLYIIMVVFMCSQNDSHLTVISGTTRVSLYSSGFYWSWGWWRW